MADLPAGMLTSGRHPDQQFAPEEELYRRVASDNLDGGDISIAAVGLPDMSVIRQKYGQPQWLLLSDDAKGWGVIAFFVRDIPPRRELWHEGVIAYVLKPRHVPHNRNYPHAEVWVFLMQGNDEIHICRADQDEHLLNPEFHLRWRECIVLASRVVIQPGGADEE